MFKPDWLYLCLGTYLSIYIFVPSFLMLSIIWFVYLFVFQSPLGFFQLLVRSVSYAEINGKHFKRGQLGDARAGNICILRRNKQKIIIYEN